MGDNLTTLVVQGDGKRSRCQNPAFLQHLTLTTKIPIQLLVSKQTASIPIAATRGWGGW